MSFAQSARSLVMRTGLAIMVSLAGMQHLPAQAQATTQVLYPFTTNLLATSVPAGTTEALSIANLNPATAVGDDGFGNVLEAYPSAGSTSRATALANNSYLSVTINRPALELGQSVLSFDIGKGGASDPRGYVVRSSVDGFAGDLLAENLPSGAPAAPVQKNVSVNAVGQTSITFRIYVWSPNPAANSIDIRNLKVTAAGATVSVPTISELGSVVLSVLLMVFAIRQRRIPRR